MQKTAKVTEVNGIRQWDGPNGTVFYHSITLDNGDQGSIGKKTEGAVKVGDELTYELIEDERGNKIKPVMANNGFQGAFRGGQQRGSSASFALSYAKDLMIAAMPFHQDIDTNTWVTATVIAATKFQGWLKENE